MEFQKQQVVTTQNFVNAEIRPNRFVIRLPVLDELEVKHFNRALTICGSSENQILCHRMDLPEGFDEPIFWNDGEIITIILPRKTGKVSCEP